MKIREVLGIIFILGIFGLFLFWLYSKGEININGIIILISGGVLFVTITHYLYKDLWSDLD